MSNTIEQIIFKQALAVKANSDKLAEAERLEKRAKQLRAECNKPVKLDLKAIRKAKDERVQKFAKALYDFKTGAAEELLTSKGWQKDGPITQPEAGNMWVNPSKPGVKIEIKGSNYVVYKNDVQQLEAPLSYLESYLKK